MKNWWTKLMEWLDDGDEASFGIGTWHNLRYPKTYIIGVFLFIFALIIIGLVIWIDNYIRYNF